MSFIEKYGLWSPEQQQAAREVQNRIRAEDLSVVRFSFPDQHGILRGKTLVAGGVEGAFKNGLTIASSLLMKDTAHRTVISVFTPRNVPGLKEMRGSADMVMVPDPTTFRVLPWAPHSGWVLCDLYYRDGRPVPIATRHLCQKAMQSLASQGYDFMSGLEVEFHLTRMVDPRLALADAGQPGEPSLVELTHRGYNYLTELNYDTLDPILETLRKNVQGLGLDLASLEVEFGPSQVEMVFNVGRGSQPADDMVLFRTAVKQVCQRHGYHASFMCRPRLPSVMSSGWHLHQSLCDRKTSRNMFEPPGPDQAMSETGLHWMGGLLSNAAAAAVFSTPTINGYKRYRPFSLAPDRAAWGIDNRGVMIRALCAPGDRASRLENRVGEPAANPYLYLASQVVAGMDGLARQIDPGPPTEAPYDNQSPLLPQTLAEAVDALQGNETFRAAFGSVFIDYITQIKRSEIRRYELEVSEWEQREYFDLF